MTRAARCTAIAWIAACTDACSAPAGHPDAPLCAPPPLAAPWLRASVERTVTLLAAAPRATTTERDAARDFLAGELTQLGLAPQRFDYPGGADLYATIDATTEPSAPGIIIGAHFDTVSGSPGANDNATGCAVVLAVTHYLADMACRTAPVTAIFFDQEEVGLFGSRAYAETISPSTIAAVITIDQVGWDSDHDRAFELELPPPDLAAAWRDAAAVVGVPVTSRRSGSPRSTRPATRRRIATPPRTRRRPSTSTTPRSPHSSRVRRSPARWRVDRGDALVGQGTVELLTTNAP